MKIIDPRVDPIFIPAGSRAVVIAKHQSEYQDLPSIRTPAGQIITRWQLSDEDRAAIAAGEDIFVTIVSHGAINPLLATVGHLDWHAMEETLK